MKGWPKMTPACATEVGNDMEVGLYTPEAEKARRAVIEFWLLNHPLDCPICDQGGECPLQDIAFDAIRPGHACSEVDDAVRAYFEEHDLWPYWRHQYTRMIELMRRERWPLPSQAEEDSILAYLRRHAGGGGG